MIATDKLCAMLDERGVPWWEERDEHGNVTTYWGFGAEIHSFNVWRDVSNTFTWRDCTPTQAIEATLGRSDPPYERLIERLAEDWGIDASWDGLRGFWNIELNDEGVRKRDEATLGRGTCRNVYDPMWCRNGFKCSVCGDTVEDCEGYEVSGTFNFCPKCGRKVET